MFFFIIDESGLDTENVAQTSTKIWLEIQKWCNILKNQGFILPITVTTINTLYKV